MQGLGFGLLIIGYGVFYAAGKQLSGTGGSVLYWMTGNTALGAPPAPTSGGGGSSSGDGTTHNGPGGSATPAKGPGGRTTLTTLGGK